jgi:hypothetical protein
MSVTITPVDIATDTFTTFIGKVNSVIDALASNVVTTNSSANGAVTSGNAQMTGAVHVNVFSTHSLHGGNNQSSAVLPITSNVSVGNSTVNVVIAFNSITLGTTVVNSSVVSAGANVYANTTAVTVGNSTVNAVLNSTSLTVGGVVSNTSGHFSGANVALSLSTLGIGNSTVNAVMNSSVLVVGRIDAATINVSGITQNSTYLGAGANVYMNATSFFVGNSTVNAVLNQTTLTIGSSIINSTAWSLGTVAANTTVVRNGANVILETARLFVGNSTVNAVINSLGLVVGTHVVNSSVWALGTTGANTTAIYNGANVIVDTVRYFTGNSTVNAVLNSVALVVGAVTANQTQVTVGTSVINSTVVAAGANVVANTLAFFVGNSTVNAVLNSVALVVGSVVANQTQVTVGTSVVNTTAVAAGANVRLETARLFVGNSTVNAIVNSSVFTIGSVTATNLTGSVVFAAAMYHSEATADRVSDTRFYSGTGDNYIHPNSALGLRKSLDLNTEYFSALFPEALSQYGTTQYLCISMPFAGTITSLTRYLTAGSITTTIQINGVAVTGLSVTANTTVQTATATGAFTFAAGANIRVVFGGTITSGDTDLSLVLEMERT